MHNILIVDDEVGILDSLKGVLEDEGYKPATAESGEACLDAVHKRPFDVVLLDIWLPGIDGLEVYDRAHAMPDMQEIPAIMMSARLPQRELEKRSIVGINKPFDLDDFLQTVKDLLE